MSDSRLTGMALEASRMQYAAEEYRRAIDLLASNHQTVADRRAALSIQADVERRLRNGELDLVAVARYAATVAYVAQAEECLSPGGHSGAFCVRCAARVCEAEIDTERRKGRT